MGASFVFISHTTADDVFVCELRRLLESHKIPVWADSRNLTGGMLLSPQVQKAIEDARHTIVVLSPNAVNSTWVLKEIKKAIEVAAQRKADGYSVIPMLLPGITPSALSLWFSEIPVAIQVRGITDLPQAMPDILSALKEQLPSDRKAERAIHPRPVSELLLTLSHGKKEGGEKPTVSARARITFIPPDYPHSPRVQSREFPFVKPLTPLDLGELEWYLESYHIWPTGLFKDRAEAVEHNLPKWGKALFNVTLAQPAAFDARSAWEAFSEATERRFSIEVDLDTEENISADQSGINTELLSLPWELLHDGSGYLFHGRNAVRVRRRVPNRKHQSAREIGIPIRILLVSPRPEDAVATFIDHRISAQALVDAVEKLGSRAEVKILHPPTVKALEVELNRAESQNERFDVVHFDGHGIFDNVKQVGALCFEHPTDQNKLSLRRHELVPADRFAAILRDHRIPLVFLEACQSGAQENPAASVAVKALQEGVSSVVAMSHSVLIETARQFATSFYSALLSGSRVGTAMLAGQRALFHERGRGMIPNAGELQLEDWFVPVLYQQDHDVQLIGEKLDKAALSLENRRRKLSFGFLPESPTHRFHGRSRELLLIERLFDSGKQWISICGLGGQGKTTLAVEAARWLVRAGFYERAAFVSLEHHQHPAAILDTLGHQLLADGSSYSVAQYEGMKEALQPIQRALREQSSVIVIDNAESLLGSRNDPSGKTLKTVEDTFQLLDSLLKADHRARLIFTSREKLISPFEANDQTLDLHSLTQFDAIELLKEILRVHTNPQSSMDADSTLQSAEDLVQILHCHPRAIVLIGQAVARQGIRVTTREIESIIQRLESTHPGNRENSLFASLELSLRRLSTDTRSKLTSLGPCKGGAHITIIRSLTSLDETSCDFFVNALAEVGLAECLGANYVRFDPALVPYLLNDIPSNEAIALTEKWLLAMASYIVHLYRQRSSDAKSVTHLTRLDARNLVSAIEFGESKLSADSFVQIAQMVEDLLSDVNRPIEFEQVTAARKRAATRLTEWSHAQFVSESSQIDRLQEEHGDRCALEAAKALLERSMRAGEDAYKDASYDIALSHYDVARLQPSDLGPEPSLTHLAEAERRFVKLAEQGNRDAKAMLPYVAGERGFRMFQSKQYELAEKHYNAAIRLSENNIRAAAIYKSQYAELLCVRKDFVAACELHANARDLFQEIGDRRRLAVSLEKLGDTLLLAKDVASAENSFREALAIRVCISDLRGQSILLGKLGNVYCILNRLEDGYRFYKQAAELSASLNEFSNELAYRTSASSALIAIKKFDAARTEIQSAIASTRDQRLSWLPFEQLEELEKSLGNGLASMSAREKAIELYLSYRLKGGQSHSQGSPLFLMVENAIKSKNTAEVSWQLEQVSNRPNRSKAGLALFSQLKKVIAGSRDETAARDPGLSCVDAVELRLLIESLKKLESTPTIPS